MDKFIQKMINIERRISDEKGPFLLFALFMPEDGHEKWDVLASASWIDKDKGKAIRYLTEKIQQGINTEELLQLSRIIAIRADNSGLTDIHNTINIEHDLLEIKNDSFFDLDIKRAYFITSQKDKNSPYIPGRKQSKTSSAMIKLGKNPAPTT